MPQVYNRGAAATAKSVLKVSALAGRGEIYVYGPIGFDFFGDGVTADSFAKELKKIATAKTIDLRINSEGGVVFDAVTMFTLLRDHGARIVTHIDGWAASAASYLAMAGDEILIAEGGYVMIHEAEVGAHGRSSALRRMADLVDKVNGDIRNVYAARTKQTPEQIAEWMDAETYFNAAEAIEAGFADRVAAGERMAARIDFPENFRRLPEDLRPRRTAAAAAIAALRKT